MPLLYNCHKIYQAYYIYMNVNLPIAPPYALSIFIFYKINLYKYIHVFI